VCRTSDLARDCALKLCALIALCIAACGPLANVACAQVHFGYDLYPLNEGPGGLMVPDEDPIPDPSDLSATVNQSVFVPEDHQTFLRRPVPEPATVASLGSLALTGGLGLLWRRHRKKRFA